MVPRLLGRSGISVSPLGFGAFKIGRNVGVKYPAGYDLPDDASVGRLLEGVLDAGINLLDTAPAYGTSEERIGAALARRRSEYVLSTKAGETFENGVSSFDFSADGIHRSVERSLRRLATEVIDILFIHSDGDDLRVLGATDAVTTVQELRTSGVVRAIGFSGKTVEGAAAALEWADALMVEYSPLHREHEDVIAAARERGVGIVVKKGLASGRLEPAEAIPFILANPGVTSVVIGGLDLRHIRANVAIAEAMNDAAGARNRE